MMFCYDCHDCQNFRQSQLTPGILVASSLFYPLQLYTWEKENLSQSALEKNGKVAEK